MRRMIAVAVGLLLLVSAAAAVGNNNIAGVDVNETMTGQVLTGASSVQLADIDANIAGNTNVEIQGMNLTAVDNILTGLNDGKTFLLQSGDMMLNDTGNNNVNWQFEFLGASENQVAIGNITQMSAEVAENEGNNNNILQVTAQGAGTSNFFTSTVVADGGSATVIVVPFFGATPSPNILTNSELKQISGFDVSVSGNTNTAEQWGVQSTFDNTMTDSKLWQQNAANADILGNDNTGFAPALIDLGSLGTTGPLTLPFGFNAIQTSSQLADDNTMTKSLANQLVCQDENIVGNTNLVGQLGVESMTLDILTNSGLLQKINEDMDVLGNTNLVGQSGIESMTLDVLTDAGLLQKINEDMDVLGNTNTILQGEILTSTANTVTGGNIVQQADIFTSS